MYIKQIANTLRTFAECFLNTHEIECEHSANSPRPPRNWLRTLRQFPTSTTKLVRNTPSGVGADSSCPYPDIAKNAYSHYQIRISPPHYVCVYVYAGAINRPLQLLTACQLRGEHSAKHQRTHREKSTNTYEKPTKHSAKHQRTPTKLVANTPPGVGGRFIVPVS